jgi:hypothetical protein
VRKYGYCQRTIYNWINKHCLRKLAQEDHKTPTSLMQENDPNRLLVCKAGIIGIGNGIFLE